MFLSSIVFSSAEETSEDIAIFVFKRSHVAKGKSVEGRTTVNNFKVLLIKFESSLKTYLRLNFTNKFKY